MARKTKAVLLIVLAALLLFTAACGQEQARHADMQAICDEIAKLPEQPEKEKAHGGVAQGKSGQ